jgi:hypothetical protein
MNEAPKSPAETAQDGAQPSQTPAPIVTQETKGEAVARAALLESKRLGHAQVIAHNLGIYPA